MAVVVRDDQGAEGGPQGGVGKAEHRGPVTADLASCSWKRYRPEMGLAVRITLGRPPRWFGHPHEEVRLLAPPGGVPAEGRRGLRGRLRAEHLNAVGVKRLSRRFRNLSEKHGGPRLVSCA